MTVPQLPTASWDPNRHPPQGDTGSSESWNAYPPPSAPAPLATMVGRPGLLPDGFTSVARAVQVLVGLCGVSSLVGIGLDLWSAAMLRSVAGQGTTATRAAIELTDVLSLYSSGATSLLMLAGGVLWLAWQHRLATAVPRAALRRSPGWHIGSWLVPVVNLWFPFQNMLDLRRAVTPASSDGRAPRTYRLWWGLFLGNTVVQWLASSAVGRGEATVAAAAQSAELGAFAEALNAGSAVFAILVVGDLTRRAVQARDAAVATAAQR